MSKWTKVMRHMMGSRLSNVGFPPRINQSELDRNTKTFHQNENTRRHRLKGNEPRFRFHGHRMPAHREGGYCAP